MPFFCRRDKGNADLDAFRAVAEELTPLLNEVELPPLSGNMLYDVVQAKKPTAGSLDGWGWRENSRLFQLLGLISWLRSSPLIEEEEV